MAANPLTSQEIESWARQAHVTFSPWEFDLICRLDDAVLAIWANKSKPAPDKGEPQQIPVSNVSGMRAFFTDLSQKLGARGKTAPTQ